MIIMRQTCVNEKHKTKSSSPFLKDFRNRYHIANGKLHLGGRKRSADSWTNSQRKTRPTRPPEKIDKDTRRTGS